MLELHIVPILISVNPMDLLVVVTWYLILMEVVHALLVCPGLLVITVYAILVLIWKVQLVLLIQKNLVVLEDKSMMERVSVNVQIH